MVAKRIVDTLFWEDSFIMDHYTSQERFLMLYLMTNPKSTQVGIYGVSKKVMAFETGLTQERVTELLDTLMYEYKHIIYNHDTQEVTLLDSLTYSIVKGGKPVTDCLNRELDKVQDTDLIQVTYNHLLEFWDQSRRSYDQTVKAVFEAHLSQRGVPVRMNENENVNDNAIENENENENEDSSHVSSNDSYDPGDILTQLVREKLNLTAEVDARPITFTGNFTEDELNAIKHFRGRLSDDVIQVALNRSADKVNPHIYALKILGIWAQAGVTDLAGVTRHDLKFQRSQDRDSL